MNDEELGLSIRVDFDDFVTRLDLDEVLQSIDRIIEQEVIGYPFPGPPDFSEYPWLFPWFKYGEPRFTYLGIRSIDKGSLIIGAFIGGAVLTYVGTRFAKGVDESLLAEQLKRSGRLSGDSLGRILERINNWAERYVKKQKAKGGNITKISAQKDDSNEKRS